MIREAIKERITALDISQGRLCSLMGMRQQDLSSYLHDKREFSLSKITLIMKTLGLTFGPQGSFVGEFPSTDIRRIISCELTNRRMKQRELSKLSGVNAACICQFLKGYTSMYIKSVEKLLDTLNLGIVCFGEPQIS